jgi:hypothetical protein
MKRILFTIGILLSLGFAGLALQAPATVLAGDAQSEICKGIGAASGTGNTCSGGGPSLTTVVRNIINIFSLVVGIVAVIMIMVAGFKYITAAGDSGSLSSAKHTLIYAMIGLVIVAMSQFIVQFVLDRVT